MVLDVHSMAFSVVHFGILCRVFFLTSQSRETYNDISSLEV